MTKLFRIDGTVEEDAAIEAWFAERPNGLGALAREWFALMRGCGDEVREVLHDGCPVACLGDVAFGYVNTFTSHVNIGFFRGASLADPAHMLEGSGKAMRHVKLRPGAPFNGEALEVLIRAAYCDIKTAVEQG